MPVKTKPKSSVKARRKTPQLRLVAATSARPEWHRRLEQFLKTQKACPYERKAALKWTAKYKKFETAYRNAEEYWASWFVHALFGDPAIFFARNPQDKYTAEEVQEKLFKRTRRPKD